MLASSNFVKLCADDISNSVFSKPIRSGNISRMKTIHRSYGRA